MSMSSSKQHSQHKHRDRDALHVLLWKSTFLVPLAFAWDVPLCMYAFGVVTPWVLICFPVAKIPCFCGASVCFCVLLCASVCFCAASVWPYLGSNGSYGPAKMIKMQMQASTSTFLGGKRRIFSKKKFFSSKNLFWELSVSTNNSERTFFIPS